MAANPTTRLNRVLRGLQGAAIAVSGGVDSMTLSVQAHRLLGRAGVRMVHAISPAVPVAATARVRQFAASEGWRLSEVDAGEFADERYRANPVNRCFFCKSNLYSTLAALADGVILSGTNCDDLGDFRPGLQAAADNAVRHPYVEAGFHKADVRRLARDLGLADVAELPSSPCLASRVETGIRIDAAELSLIDRVESWLRAELSPEAVRCRIRHAGLVIELDAVTLAGLGDHQHLEIIAGVTRRLPAGRRVDVSIAAYRQGSAFVGADGEVAR
jgi:uncharacterized protein